MKTYDHTVEVMKLKYIHIMEGLSSNKSNKLCSHLTFDTSSVVLGAKSMSPTATFHLNFYKMKIFLARAIVQRVGCLPYPWQTQVQPLTSHMVS